MKRTIAVDFGIAADASKPNGNRVLRRRRREAGIRVIITPDTSCASREDIIRRMVFDGFMAFAEKRRKGNRSIVDWKGPIGVGRQHDPAARVAEIMFAVSYIVVPRRHYEGRVLTWKSGSGGE